MSSKEVSPSQGGCENKNVSATIVERCQLGHRSAQESLYESCHQRVYRLMYRMVGPQDAQDLTQDVFLRVFRKISQFSGRSSIETWIHRLAINEALQFLRKQSRHRQQSLADEPMTPDTKIQQSQDDRELLEVALSRIEPDLRAVFLLRSVESLSYREISEALDISEGTVGSRLNRARNQLQEQLDELGWRR